MLTWKVDKTIPVECPDFKPNPYTGEYPSTHCAVCHFESITEEKASFFATEKEAKDFAFKAPPSCYDFKLNGELLEDKRKKPDGSVVITGSGTITDTLDNSFVLKSDV